MNTSTKKPEIGIVVDAGPQLGYGHAVRCVRLGRALERDNRVAFYPMSDVCREFIESCGVESMRLPESDFPSLVITDLREPHGITATIRRHGAKHISIHDLGLAQCHSDVVIDGSVTNLFPYHDRKERELFLGPQFMITRDAVPRKTPTDTVLITFGGGATARFASQISEHISLMGLTPLTTRGFLGSEPMTDAEFEEAMATCRFAISGSGVTLYDLLASGVPTIAVAFDRLQLRTAAAFHELGAALNLGLLDRLTPGSLLRCCREMLENPALVQRTTESGQTLVDGKGLSRVVEIVRRQLWLINQTKTFMVC